MRPMPFIMICNMLVTWSKAVTGISRDNPLHTESYRLMRGAWSLILNTSPSRTPNMGCPTFYQ